MSDSEEDGDVFSGLARPVLTASTLVDEDDEEEERKVPTGNADQAASESEVDDASGLVGAEAAFDFDTAPEALELDPFRMAGPIQGASTSAPSGEKMKGGKDAQHGKQMTKKIFVGGLPWDLGDAGLVKFFVRFGKVQEASVVRHVALPRLSRHKACRATSRSDMCTCVKNRVLSVSNLTFIPYDHLNNVMVQPHCECISY
eukprot:4358646-Pleurochrysis_carterae.AAC.1